MEEHAEVNRTFNILSIDGGGLRGIYPLHILSSIQKKFAVDLADYFDLIVGTSTGSIIASAIAVGIELDSVIEMYEKYGTQIFPTKPIKCGLITSKYSNTALKTQLDRILGNKCFDDINKTNLIIPATDIYNGSVFIFKSPYSKDFVRDPKIKLSDAVLASCSAPTYFNPLLLGNYKLADGGLWANNPALIAYTEARKRFRVNEDNIRILSIGTGLVSVSYDNILKKRFWGFLTRWQRGKLLDLILSLQSQSVDNYLKTIMANNIHNYLRINYASDKDLPLDEPRILSDYKSKADKDFTHKSDIIKDFLRFRREL